MEKRKSGQVLLASADTRLSTIAEEMISLSACHADVVFSPDETLHKVVKKKYWLIIIDSELASFKIEKSAPPLVSILRAYLSTTQILVMLNKIDIEKAVEYIRKGASDCISRPLTRENMAKKIESSLTAYKRAVESEMAATRTFEPDSEFGYNYIRKIDSGSMGDVFLVEKNSHLYAMKKYRISRKSGKKNQSSEKELKEVISKAASIRNPNVIKVKEYFFPDNSDSTVCVVMEYIKGQKLTSFIGNTKLKIDSKIDIIKQIASALTSIHKYGIIHRDLKPDNIVIKDDSYVKVTDFSISCIDGLGNRKNGISGTPAYMAPESFDDSSEITEKSDIFSFGILSYELLTGLRPFYGDTMGQMRKAIQDEHPPQPSKIVRYISPELQDIIASMLLKDPSMRPSAKELYGALTFLQDGKVEDCRMFNKFGTLLLRSVWK